MIQVRNPAVILAQTPAGKNKIINFQRRSLNFVFKDLEAEIDPRNRTGRREEKIKQGEFNDGKFVGKLLKYLSLNLVNLLKRKRTGL